MDTIMKTLIRSEVTSVLPFSPPPESKPTTGRLRGKVKVGAPG